MNWYIPAFICVVGIFIVLGMLGYILSKPATDQDREMSAIDAELEKEGK